MARIETSAADFLPQTLTLTALREAAKSCRGCELYARATQTVFGEGRQEARVMLVGEQPGDAEDVAGRPFVGPAGRLLDEALAAAGIPRADAYVTNAVKHFKFTRSEKPQRGKKRIHGKPSTTEVRACQPWLLAELTLIRPAILVLLGATAAQSVLGLSFRVTRHRGEVMSTTYAPWTIATVHPASVLRAPTEAARAEARAAFFADIAVAGPLYHEALHGAQ
jgi:DNA polymerase